MTHDEAIKVIDANWPSENYTMLREALTMAKDALRAHAVTGEAERAHGYLSRVLAHCAPQCQPLPDLMGLCSQIDNLIAGLRAAPPFSLPKPTADTRGVLPDHLTDGFGACLPWCLRCTKAEAALAGAPPDLMAERLRAVKTCDDEPERCASDSGPYCQTHHHLDLTDLLRDAADALTAAHTARDAALRERDDARAALAPYERASTLTCHEVRTFRDRHGSSPNRRRPVPAK